jgi:hypothetical protein
MKDVEDAAVQQGLDLELPAGMTAVAKRRAPKEQESRSEDEDQADSADVPIEVEAQDSDPEKEGEKNTSSVSTSAPVVKEAPVRQPRGGKNSQPRKAKKLAAPSDSEATEGDEDSNDTEFRQERIVEEKPKTKPATSRKAPVSRSTRSAAPKASNPPRAPSRADSTYAVSAKVAAIDELLSSDSAEETSAGRSRQMSMSTMKKTIDEMLSDDESVCEPENKRPAPKSSKDKAPMTKTAPTTSKASMTVLKPANNKQQKLLQDIDALLSD